MARSSFWSRLTTLLLVAAAALTLSVSRQTGAVVQAGVLERLPANTPAAPTPAHLLNYQGRLVDPATGAPKADGSYSMTFRIYDAATDSNVLWTEIKDVTVAKGLFSTLLGDTTALDPTIFNGSDRWLGVKVGSDAETAPRMAMAFAPYASWAINAGMLDGQDSTKFAAASHTHSAADITSDQLSTNNFSALDDLYAEGAVGFGVGQLAEGSHSHSGFLLHISTINSTCLGDDNIGFGTTFTKLADIGSFTKTHDASTLEVTFNGRIAVITSLFGAGALFELRVDDTAASMGRGRASFKKSEVGSDGKLVSMTGFFAGLKTGLHTVSMWVAASSGTGAGAMVDPGCWSSDSVSIKEYLD